MSNKIITLERLKQFKDLFYNIIITNFKDIITEIEFLSKKGKDITNLLQSLIDKNDGRTINIPSGDYYISSTIEIPCDGFTSIKMSPTTHIHVAETNHNLECMFRIGETKVSKDYSKRQKQLVQVINGGNLDCYYADKGIILTKTQISRIENLNMYNVRIGIETQNWGDTTQSTDYKINNVVILGITSCDTTSIGIVNNTWDNEYQHLRIEGVSTGMLFNKGGCQLHDIHLTTIFTSDFTLDKFHATVGINVKTGWIDMSQVYLDNFSTQLLLTGARAFLSNCHFFWYYNNTNATYKLISLQGDSYVDVNNSTLEAPSLGTQYIITTNIRPYTDISRRVHLNNCKINVPNANIADLGNNLLFNNNNFYDIWKVRMDNTKYYQIGVLERNYASTTRFILNMATDLQADISIFYTNSTPSIRINNLLNNSGHKIQLFLGNEFRYEDKMFCYIYLKAEDTDTYNNAYISVVNSFGGGLYGGNKIKSNGLTSINQIGTKNLYPQN